MRGKRLDQLTMRHGAGHRNAGRRIWVAGLAACLVFAPMAALSQQVTAPRYRGTIEAPTRQLSLPTPPPVSSPNATVVEDIIARVNDQVIDRSDLIRQQGVLQQEAQQGKIPSSELATMQHDLLREMIDEQLLLSRGKELDLNVDSEVVRQLDEIRKQNHLDSMEALEKAVRDSGISYEDWRADMKNRMVRQMVIRDEVGRKMARPTPKDEQTYYDAHKQDFRQPEKVRLSEILIPTPENATDAAVAQAQAKAQEVSTKLQGGAKFQDLAKQYSGGQTADKGGDLGQFEKGQLAKVLEDQTFSLQPGQWTQPIRTRQGFVVLEVTEHNPGGVPPLKDVEEQVQEGMYQEQMQPALRRYLTSLREKAYIDIAPGFTDSGASGKEVKTVTEKQRMVPARTAALAATAATKDAAASPSTTAAAGAKTAPATVQTASLKTGKKKKIRREKIRFGQAPENALPPGQNETASAGVDQGAGATSSVLPSTTVPDATPADSLRGNSTVASTDVDPLAPAAPLARKTRFSDRAAEESARKAQEKAAKVKQKQLEVPVQQTAVEHTTSDVQNSALGLAGDTATKKKKKKDKSAPKERLQSAPPAAPAPKPDATPIPSRTVRQNGEPAGTAPASDRTTLPPATTPAPGAPVDTQPATPSDPVPHPMPPQ
jgi:peptidyl-prolyl cis-trans isomerase SurA